MRWREIAESQVSGKSEVYVDMDGVLADFFGEWAKLAGVSSFRDIQDPESALDLVRNTENFWLNLPKTANADALLDLIISLWGSYKILSTPLTGDPASMPHKIEWVRKNLQGRMPTEILLEHDKAQYATQPDGTPNILIDDYGVNIRKWQAAGGIGIKHKDHKLARTIKHIQQQLASKKNVSENKKKEIGIHRSSQDFDTIDLSKSADGTFWLNSVDSDNWATTVTSGSGIDHAFEILPQARLATWDDIDRYSIDELENQGYDGVRMQDGNDVSYQIWNTAVLKRINLDENFADGKVKGKSRPGRAKRAGVDCSKSVTDLRKMAKNSSGEKQKMAHWCANMKAGKKK